MSVDILFDIDGTLVRTYPVEDELYEHALRSIGLSLPTTDYQALGASTDISILRVLAQRAWERDPSAEEIAQVRDAHTRGWAEHLQATAIELVPGARDVLAELSSRGVRFAAATGGFRVTATAKLAAARLHITIAGAAEDGHDRAELVAHAAAKQRPIYVGDGLWDADAAEKNGLGFIGVAETRERAEAFRRRGARVVTDLTQLVAMLLPIAK